MHQTELFRNFLAVGAGGAVGAMLRYGMTVLGMSLHWSSNLSTFLVNIIGSFVMGLLVSSCEQGTWLLMAWFGCLLGQRAGHLFS